MVGKGEEYYMVQVSMFPSKMNSTDAVVLCCVVLCVQGIDLDADDDDLLQGD